MRSPRGALLLLLVALSVLNVWFAYVRSGIPRELTGTVEAIEVRREKHPGLDDVYLVTVDGDVHHLDAATAKLLRVGDAMEHEAGSHTLRTPQGTLLLEPSLDTRRLAIAMPLLVLLGLALVVPRGRDSRAT